MMTTGDAMLGDDASHVGVALQAPNVIDDGRAGFQRPGRDAGFAGIDRDRNAERGDRRQDRCKPLALLVERHRAHAAIGTGRFRADIDNIGALGGEPPGLLDSRRRLQKTAAVRKRIRRHVENAHNQRARQRPGFGQKLRQYIFRARNRRGGRSLAAAVLAIIRVIPSGIAKHYFAERY